MDAVIFRAEDEEDWEEHPQSARRLAPDPGEEPDDDLAGSRYDDAEEWSDEESEEAGERRLDGADGDNEAAPEPPPARRRQVAAAASRLAGGPRMAVDDILDELLPEQLDWQRIVKTYPLTAVLVAAAGGFVLGRYKGLAVVTALSAFAADAVADNVNELLGDELL